MADNPLSTFLPDRAATGFFPQMKPRRRFQDREGSANVPLDVMRGRLAGMLGTPTDLANIFRSPMPTEMFGETNYEPAQQLPYGSEYFLKNLPLAPTSRVGEVAGQAGSFVPLNPMPAARAAAAGVKALGPTAGRMAEQYLTRTGGILPLDVYHGTPHRFQPTATNPLGEFDASTIGTGEGAQAYGHGLYFAENPTIATGYKETLARQQKDRLTIDGKMVDPDSVLGRSAEDLSRIGLPATLQKIDDNIKFNSKYAPDMADMWRGVRAQVEKLDPSRVALKEGSLYKVDLPDEQIAKMLDWDKPLSQQGENIRLLFPEMGTPASKALKKEAEGQKVIADSLYASGDKEGAMAAMQKRSLLEARRQAGLLGETQGQDAYKALMTAIGENPIQLTSTQGSFGTPAIAQHLRELGIPGIKYLDATSRNGGKSTRNFVTFPGEEKSLTILERNGQPGQNSLKSFIK